MAKTREKRLDELNYIPLMIEYFGAPRTTRLLGFFALWGLSGCPQLADMAYRNVYGLSRAGVYRYFTQVAEWAVWLRDVKGITNIADDIDSTLQLARLGLAAVATSQQPSQTVDKPVAAAVS